ncbi:hypothetical protein [Komarekiella delphini-convector]|nr:hypothetical protein [Komarekiella delphini-convector]
MTGDRPTAPILRYWLAHDYKRSPNSIYNRLLNWRAFDSELQNFS